MFVTLTYSDYYLPVTNGVRHFNTSHIRTFFCELRIFLKRAGYDSKGLRYFLVSEYGSKYKRPHYHLLLFFPYKINSYKLINLQGDGFVQRAWKFGFSSYSKNGAYVTSVKALSYCCKYLAKFEDFYTQYGSYELTKQHSSYKPFHRQSKGFGLYLLNLLSKDEKLGNYYLYHEDMKSRNIPLPRYIQRKLYYIYDKTNSLFRLNQLGQQVKANAIFKRLDEFSEKVDNFLSASYEKLLPVADKFLEFTGFDSLDSFYHHFKTSFKTDKRTFVNLSFLRDYVDTGIHDLFNFISDSLYKQANLPILDYSPLTNHAYFKKLKRSSYAYTSAYLKHGDLFQYIDIVDDIINQSTNDSKRVTRKSVESTKEFFNNIGYVQNHFFTPSCAC